MPALTRKHQIATALDPSPATAGTLAGSGVVDTVEASFSSTRNFLSREPGGGSLSRSVEAPAAGEGSVQIVTDCKGSGTPTTATDWSRFLRAAFCAEGDLVTITTDSSGAVNRILPGDILTNAADATEYCVVMSEVPVTGAETTFRAVMLSGAFAGGETLDSANHGTGALTIKAATAPSASGKAYTPLSGGYSTFELANASWTGGTPVVGDGVRIYTETSGVQTTIGEAIIIGGIGTTTLQVRFAWGTVDDDALLATDDSVTNAADSTADLQTGEAPTISVASNLDGLRRDLQFGRANASLAVNAGEAGRWTFNVTGQQVDWDDVGRFTTGVPSVSTSPPRFAGGFMAVNGHLFPVKSFAFDTGLTINTIADGNAPNGERGAEITDRAATMTVEVERTTLAALNWQSLRDSATPVRVGFVIGTAAGNIVAVAGTNAQISEVSDGDSDGIVTHSVGFALRAYSGTGDDEFVVATY